MSRKQTRAEAFKAKCDWRQDVRFKLERLKLAIAEAIVLPWLRNGRYNEK